MFFVRVKGTESECESRVRKAFGVVEEVEAGFPDEYAFVTGEMTEEAYEKGAQAVGNVINKIRILEIE